MSPRLSELPPPPLGRTGWPWSTETPSPDALAALSRTTNPAASGLIVAGVMHNLRSALVFGGYTAGVSSSRSAEFFSIGVNEPGSHLHPHSVQVRGSVREDLRLSMDLDRFCAP